MQTHYKTVILGAGAAGMMAAIHAGGDCLVVDHAKSPGEKIRISGGGRCNFTNIHASPANFISQNKHFAKSALSRYTAQDFIKLVEAHNIAYHEKTLGQLFCDESAKDIIALLLKEMTKAGAKLSLQTSLTEYQKTESGFALTLSKSGKATHVTCDHFVVACGGKSIPKMGATGFGYEIAEQFSHSIIETRPALVPLTFAHDILAMTQKLAGLSLDVSVRCGKVSFDEAMLFTHRGLSGPSILQISSYWREKLDISLNLKTKLDVFSSLKDERGKNGKHTLFAFLASIMPKRLAEEILARLSLSGNLADQSDKKLQQLANAINNWTLQPIGSEGYRTAEVTLGGVDTKDLNSRTLESKHVNGLYFIGEVVDVTGWLGGYNFQWAWSSGFAAGTAIASR
ncbi:MAG: NAD(P)/FAD-dependent oxidoreductase [Hyphomicrobiales bacterium]